MSLSLCLALRNWEAQASRLPPQGSNAVGWSRPGTAPRAAPDIVAALVLNRNLALAACAFALIAAGCGDGEEDSSGPDTAATGRETTPAPRKGTEIKVAGSEFGKMLFDSGDQAIYLFEKETSTKPACYGACADAWPPVLTKGAPVAGGGADQAKLGTTRRADGGTQVTYAGHPLYYYAREGPGQVLCHNVEEFGGLWLVVQPNGDPAPA